MDVSKITVDDAAVKAALAKLKTRLGNKRPLMAKLAGILHDAVEANFAAEGRPKWQPLAAATIRQRRKAGTWPGRILQGRGSLAASVEPGSNESEAWAGTNKRYARIQQLGGDVTIPERHQVNAHGADRKFVSRREAGKSWKRYKGQATRVWIGRIGAHTLHIPARPFLSLAPPDVAKIVKAVKDWIGPNS